MARPRFDPTPEVKVVMIGMESDEQTFMQAVRAGAVGYVLKEASAQEIVSGVRAVANGEAVVTLEPGVAAVLLMR